MATHSSPPRYRFFITTVGFFIFAAVRPIFTTLFPQVPTPPSQAYSPTSAVLPNEILKGLILFCVAIICIFNSRDSPYHKSLPLSIQHVCHEIFSTNSWTLSIPAVLYVIQNSLQLTAIGNLPGAQAYHRSLHSCHQQNNPNHCTSPCTNHNRTLFLPSDTTIECTLSTASRSA